MNEHLINILKTVKKFTVQLVESTNVGSCLILMICACFVNPVNAFIEEEFLLSKELPTQTIGQEIF